MLVLVCASIAVAQSSAPPPSSLTPIAPGPDGSLPTNAILSYDQTLVPNDSTIHVGSGPGGSPGVDPIITVACPPSLPSCTSATEDFIVTSGVVTAVTMTLNASFNVGTFFCGISDAFINENFFSADVGGVYTCNFGVGAPDPSEAPGSESFSQLQTDCYATNLATFLGVSSIYSDPDDCAGVPAGYDLILAFSDTTPGASSTANVTITPEPSSGYLLLFGMIGLGCFRRYKLAN